MARVRGSWNGPFECVSGWAKSFKAWNDYQYFGLIMFHIECYDWKGSWTEIAEFIPTNSNFTLYGGWSALEICPGYLVGYKIFGCCCPHYFNNVGANNLKMFCSGGEELYVDAKVNYDGDTHGWSYDTYCPSGSAICGFYAKFDETFAGDGTGLNDLRFACCRICNPKSSVYPSGTSCLYCDMNCLTCTTSASTCDTCGGTDTFSSGVCVKQSNVFTVVEEFTGTAATFSVSYASGGWTGGNFSSYSSH